jgi:plasmid stabilization system protein ParE
MKQLIYSEKCLADLRSIRDYIARDNLQAAIELGEGFLATCELIAQQPEFLKLR